LKYGLPVSKQTMGITLRFVLVIVADIILRMLAFGSQKNVTIFHVILIQKE
jgi:hypothetical protein